MELEESGTSLPHETGTGQESVVSGSGNNAEAFNGKNGATTTLINGSDQPRRRGRPKKKTSESNYRDNNNNLEVNVISKNLELGQSQSSNLNRHRNRNPRLASTRNNLTNNAITATATAARSQPSFSFSDRVKEDHGKPTMGVAFHTKLSPGQPTIFATVGDISVTIYQCILLSIEILHVYNNPDEEFYTCAFTSDSQGHPLLAVAGRSGIIRIICPVQQQHGPVKDLLGHGAGIDHLVFHPKDGNLLVSASEDYSLRLWNIATGHCVAIFGGVEGHRDRVLTADLNLAGNMIVSGGMDGAIKVWRLDRPDVMEAIRNSYTWQSTSIQNQGDRDVSLVLPFPTTRQMFPYFSTGYVHSGYVDCVKWFGNFILSKSQENTIVCWKGGSLFQKWNDVVTGETTAIGAKATEIATWEVEKCDSLFFLRFGLHLDPRRKFLALGNEVGETFVFDLNGGDPEKIAPFVLKHPECTTAIRQTAFSRDGGILICVCEDGTVWRWDLVSAEQNFKFICQHGLQGVKKKKANRMNKSDASLAFKTTTESEFLSESD